MTAQKHPIAHLWIKQTLVPFLLHAFASTLPYPADISEQVQRSIDFCLYKPDHPSDGDDLVFERIFMAIMHRYKNLAPDLAMVVDHLEPLAKYLIRRAQLKGPYELLGQSDIGSSAWMEYERNRLSTLYLELEEETDELRPPVRPPSATTKLPSTQDDLDPRLVHAQSGHFAVAKLLGNLSIEEDRYYRQQNREFEQAHLRRQHQLLHIPVAPAQTNRASYSLLGGGLSNMTNIHESPYHHLHRQQQQHQRPPAQTSWCMEQQTQQQTGQFTPGSVITKSQPHPQVLQPSFAVSSSFRGNTPAQMYGSEQRPMSRLRLTQTTSQMLKTQYYSAQMGAAVGSAPLQPQAAVQQQPPRLPPFNYTPDQHQPAEDQTSQQPGFQQWQTQSTQLARQYSQCPTLLPQTLTLQTPLPPQATPPPSIAPSSIPSSDFTHFRGSDWSNAAQQRAREIAAKTAAQERDTMAQGIMQRQQFLAQKPPSLVIAPSMCSPTKPVPVQDTPDRPQSAMAFLNNQASGNALAYANASAYTDTPANPPMGTNTRHAATRGTAAPVNSGWGMTHPENGSRAGLPTLEQVRSRYHPPAPASSAAAASTASKNMYALQTHQKNTVQPTATQNMLLQQPHTLHPTWNDGHTDALQQLRDAAGWEDGTSAQSWLDDGITGVGPQTGVAGQWLKEEGDRVAEMNGV